VGTGARGGGDLRRRRTVSRPILIPSRINVCAILRLPPTFIESRRATSRLVTSLCDRMGGVALSNEPMVFLSGSRVASRIHRPMVCGSTMKRSADCTWERLYVRVWRTIWKRSSGE
jgi:hypothetical protein